MGTAILVLVLVAGLGVVEYFVLRRVLLRIVDPRAILRELRSEVDALLVELNQATERNISLIEDRIRNLSDKLREADKRIGILRREAARREETLRAYAALRAASGTPAAASGTPAAAATAPAAAHGEDVEEQEMRRRVVNLYRSGVSTSLIARRLKLSRGEVELIVSLEAEGEEQ